MSGKYTKDSWKKTMTKEQKAQWKRFCKLKDEDIDTSDIPELKSFGRMPVSSDLRIRNRSPCVWMRMC
jgi:hypothetical protein